MTDKQRAYLHLHFCVLIWGFTAILGGLISLKALPLVWWRVSLACLALLFIVPMAQLRSLERGVFWRLFGVGLLVGLHWLCFYGAIKLANASVAVVTMATTSFFAAFTEPLFMRSRLKWYELALGVIILPGMALVVENIDFSMRLGFAVGIVGALLAAIFSVLNKKIVDSPAPPPAFAMSFVELFAIVAMCSALMPFFPKISPGENFWPQGRDWLWLMLLAWVCTVLPYYLTLNAMKHLSAFTTNLAINLEPVYGVVLAGLILHEHRDLKPGFYAGVAIILLAVFGHPFVKSHFEKKDAD